MVIGISIVRKAALKCFSGLLCNTSENFVKVASTKKQWNKIHERCYGVCFVGEVLIIFSGTL